MWTPKRIILLVFGFAQFFAGYMLYAHYLGCIDGLPPLPDRYLPANDPLDGPVAPPQRTSSLEEKLRLAFGQECAELKRPIKLELHSKNMVLAAGEFEIIDKDKDPKHEGWVRFQPISVVLFGKEANDGRGVEINTIRAQVAYVQFDKKIGSSEKEIGGGRRIVAAELAGNIEIVNNHRTPERDDDLHLIIDNGPLYYSEARRLIWTEDNVHLEDDQSKPPLEIRGQGMEVHLTAEQAAPSKPGAPPQRGKGKGEAMTGVERIVLHSNVDMHLYVDAHSDFLSGQPDKPAAPAAPAKAAAAPPAEKAHVAISTAGRFEYTLGKEHDLAHFDVAERDPARPNKSAQDVKVVRQNRPQNIVDQMTDQLLCQHLELVLGRKAAAPAAKDAPVAREESSADRNLEVKSAHATGVGDEEVVLTSDAEKLIAHGLDFFYDAGTRTSILKGDPARPDAEMWADKDGTVLHARELQIQEQHAGEKSWQQVTALGRGHIEMFDKKTEKKNQRASWNEKLISTKDGGQDLMILIGSAHFEDDEHKQTLQAETLKVWLCSTEANPPAAGKAAAAPAAGGGGMKPNHIEALGNVSARSAEMNIHDTNQLIVWFRDVPPGTLPAPAPKAVPEAKPAPKEPQAAAPAAGPPATAPPPAAKPLPAGTPADAPPQAASPVLLEAPKADADAARPVDLSARSVKAWVSRGEVKTPPDGHMELKNNLDKVWCEGDVVVHQDPAKPDEKGVDVKGEVLEMIYHPEGNDLNVSGDLGQLRMDKIYILGPEVNINQALNQAKVNGGGAMQMESAADFQGNALKKPVPLTVHWNSDMFFTGLAAEFSGGVQAEQENSHLLCQSLQVAFDKPISLKEGTHGSSPARVRTLVCDKNVRVEDKVLEGDRLVKYQRINAPALTMTALEPEDDGKKAEQVSEGNEVRGPGPGDLRIFQRGGADPTVAPPAPGARAQAAKAADDKPKPGADGKTADEMKLTYINFRGSMYVNTKTNTATFLENVRVLSMPCDNPFIEVDLDTMLDDLPKGSMYMRSERLDVYNRGDKTHSQQEMTAKGRVLVQAREFYGRSDVMTYNEAKDQIIFEGGDGGVATLYKIKQVGAKPQEIKGKKITYIRSTGMFSIDGGEWISGETTGTGK